ncbi:Methyltransferase-like protein 23 [Geodia barretti]|uniref:Methyltransferase-like protein 23 n=1 Tax=Geodia barretti TaxID=519541 RepID=A0AA35TVY9_GEOBA|nr:Methyltransferase-like protein 23 [Geodia barretti]
MLGAGTAVPGITAAKVGARLTTLTDRATSQRLTAALRQTCHLNRIPDSRVQILPLSWGVFSPQLLDLPPQDILLASDCFYDSADFEDILATVSYFMDKNRHCKFWTSYQERSSNRSLWALLQRWGLRCEIIPLESVHGSSLWVKLEGPGVSKLNSPHTLRLWEISKHC